MTEEENNHKKKNVTKAKILMLLATGQKTTSELATALKVDRKTIDTHIGGMTKSQQNAHEKKRKNKRESKSTKTPGLSEGNTPLIQTVPAIKTKVYKLNLGFDQIREAALSIKLGGEKDAENGKGKEHGLKQVYDFINSSVIKKYLDSPEWWALYEAHILKSTLVRVNNISDKEWDNRTAGLPVTASKQLRRWARTLSDKSIEEVKAALEKYCQESNMNVADIFTKNEKEEISDKIMQSPTAALAALTDNIGDPEVEVDLISRIFKIIDNEPKIREALLDNDFPEFARVIIPKSPIGRLIYCAWLADKLHWNT